MSETSFVIQNAGQTVKVNPNEISGNYDSLNTYLNIHLYFVFKPPFNDTKFDIISITGQLKFQNGNQLLSEIVVPVSLSSPRNESPAGVPLYFNMSDEAIHYIEKNRDGDLFMQLDIKIQALIKSAVPGAIANRVYSVDYIHIDTIRLPFQIPRSVWVEKILPKLGYRNLRLIEIPVSHNILKEAYADIISEFDKAEVYFNSHDYNKCVAHCRSTLDAIHRNLLIKKKDGKVETSFKWLDTVTIETITWLTELDKATFGLTSKSHHAGQKKDFGRQETESIYLIILGLLNYIGHIKP